MLWSFIAVFFSGWLYVDASYRGPAWQRWLFKPVTLLLLIALAWQSPLLGVPGYLVMAALLATLIGDLLLLLRQRTLPALAAYLLAHLAYTVSFFSSQLSLGFFWPLPLTLLAVTALLLAALWTKLESERWPVAAFVIVTALMTWVAGEHYFALGSDRNFALLAGAALLYVGHAVWLIHHFRHSFRAHQAILAVCYFGGHFLIVRSLYF